MRLSLLLFLFALALGCGTPERSTGDEGTVSSSGSTDSATDSVVLHPIYHGSLVLEQGGRTIFVDPHDGAERYTAYGAPDLVLITHTHGDHLDSATLSGIDLTQATLIAPQAVMDAISNKTFADMHTMGNGDDWTWQDIEVSAIPAYNPPPKENFHPEGQFNGYVLEFTRPGERVYISGDTEGVPAMRGLDDIDVAFVCMNLPYTMDIEQAADAVAEFAPAVVYPYHYRNQDGTKSDVAAFARMVSEADGAIEVRQAEWYTE